MKTLILAVAGLAVASMGFAQGGMQGGSQNAGGQGGAEAQVAAMVKAVNDAEISQAKLAEQNAKSTDVKRYARMMLRDHTKNNMELALAQKRAGIQPESNQDVQNLQNQAQQTRQQLESQSGSDFDTSYIQAQIQEHQAALQKLDDAISSSQTPAFKQFLNKTRGAVAHHLSEAKTIQAKLSGSTQPSGGNQ